MPREVSSGNGSILTHIQQTQTIRAIRVPKTMGSPGGTSFDSCGDANAANGANRIDAQRERLTPTRLIFFGTASGSLQYDRSIPRHFNKDKQI